MADVQEDIMGYGKRDKIALTGDGISTVKLTKLGFTVVVNLNNKTREGNVKRSCEVVDERGYWVATLGGDFLRKIGLEAVADQVAPQTNNDSIWKKKYDELVALQQKQQQQQTTATTTTDAVDFDIE